LSHFNELILRKNRFIWSQGLEISETRRFNQATN
jgi:hypothetical protein